MIVRFLILVLALSAMAQRSVASLPAFTEIVAVSYTHLTLPTKRIV